MIVSPLIYLIILITNASFFGPGYEIWLKVNWVSVDFTFFEKWQEHAWVPERGEKICLYLPLLYSTVRSTENQQEVFDNYKIKMPLAFQQ